MIFRRKREKLTGSCFVTEGGKGVFATQVQKNFFDGREQNGEAQRKAMKLHQESLGRAETPEALDGFVIMREGDSSARDEEGGLVYEGKNRLPGDMENLRVLRNFVFAFY